MSLPAVLRKPPRLSLLLSALLLLTALGLALRLYRVDTLLYGMHPDEGWNALDALDILAGQRPIFLTRNNGREPLFIYLIASSMGVFGPSIWSVRLTGALVGALVVPAQYLLVSRLPLPRPRLTALLSAAFIATSFWPLHQSHKALRAGMLPLWVTLMLWAWWSAVRDQWPTTSSAPDATRRFARRDILYAALSGAFIGGAVYTHLTGRALPLILIGSAVWIAWRTRRPHALALAGLACVTAALISLPLALYFRANPERLTERTDQISVLTQEVNQGDPIGMLVENAQTVLGMFHVSGPPEWYENLAGRPVFDWPAGLAFLIGLALLAGDLSGRRGPTAQAMAWLLLLTLGLALSPALLTKPPLKYIRLTACWPVLFLLPAWGLERAASRLGQVWRWGGAALIVVVLTASATVSGYDLFQRYANSSGLLAGARAGEPERGENLVKLASVGTVYITPSLHAQPVVRFLTHSRPPRVFEMGAGLVLPPDGAAYYAFDPVEAQDADAFGRQWPQLERVTVNNPRGQVSLLVYYLAPDRRPTLAGSGALSAAATFGDHIQLQAHQVHTRPVTAGQPLRLSLQWLALSPTPLDLNFFVHLVGADGRGLGQFDGPPLRGSYPTHRWVSGEQVLQTIEIPVARDAPVGQVTLRVGWYDWRTGERLPIAGDDDAAADITQFVIER